MEETSRRTIIRLRGIYKRFYIGAPTELEILHGIDLDVREGEFLSIVGPSGSGKSTLMKSSPPSATGRSALCFRTSTSSPGPTPRRMWSCL